MSRTRRIEQLAAVAERTDEVAVRRQLFGWREPISTDHPDRAHRVLRPECGLVGSVRHSAPRGSGLRTRGAVRVLPLVPGPRDPLGAAPPRRRRAGIRTRPSRDPSPRMVRQLSRTGEARRSLSQLPGEAPLRDLPLANGGVVVAERLLDLFVVFGLLVVDGYVAFGRTILPDLNILYVTGSALGLVILLGLIGLYAIGPRLGRFFPAEVRRIGRLFREGVLHSFRALPVAGPMTLLVGSSRPAALPRPLRARSLPAAFAGDLRRGRIVAAHDRAADACGLRIRRDRDGLRPDHRIRPGPERRRRPSRSSTARSASSR